MSFINFLEKIGNALEKVAKSPLWDPFWRWWEFLQEQELKQMQIQLEFLHKKKVTFVILLPITLSISFVVSSFITFVFLFIIHKFHLSLLFYQPSQAINYTDLLIFSSLFGGISTFIGLSLSIKDWKTYNVEEISPIIYTSIIILGIIFLWSFASVIWYLLIPFLGKLLSYLWHLTLKILGFIWEKLTAFGNWLFHLI